MKHLLAHLLVSVLAVLACAHASAQELLKLKVGELELTAHWYAASGGGKSAPVIIALHGCAGMLARNGKPSPRNRDYATLLNQQGWHVMFIDSLTGRGYDNVCGRSRTTVMPQDRVADVQAAVAQLAKMPAVDSKRIGILGWSHGGSASLLSNAEGVAYEVQPKAAVAFYPGCGADTVPRHWKPAAPMLMQLGGSDDWTNPVPCQKWAAQWPERITQDTYEGEGHAFDSGTPQRALQIPAGSGGTRTVHIGGNGAANEQARQRMIEFFKSQFQ